ncbi:MAG: ATP-binding protein [Acidobacteriota bacterium]|nr:ATP-binding protein [Acidobacteriota bacterium]
MTSRSLAHRLQYCGYWLLSRGIHLLPRRAVSSFGRWFGRVAYRLLASRRRLTQKNLAGSFPAKSAEDCDALGRRCFAHFGSAFLEALAVSGYEGKALDDIFEFEGLHHLHSALQRGNGTFLLTAHFGSWDLITYAAPKQVGEMHILYRPQNNRLVADDIAQLRRRTGVEQVPRRRSAHKMLNILRADGVIAMAIDQRVRPTEGVLIPFLGRLAWTTSVPAQLSIATGAPAVPIFCVPRGDGRYTVTFHEPIVPQDKGEAEIVRLTRRYMKVIEDRVAEAPELWFWPHTRWKRSARQSWPESIERLRKTSRLPPSTDLATLLTGPAGEEAGTLGELIGDERFIEHCRHLVLTGGPRPQRTELAAAFGRAMVESGHSVTYARLDDLLKELAEERDRDALHTRLRRDDSKSLVIIDGAELHELEPGAAELLGTYLEHRRPRGSLLLAADIDAWRLAAAPGLGAGEIRTFLGEATALNLPPRAAVQGSVAATERPPAALEAESDTPAS